MKKKNKVKMGSSDRILRAVVAVFMALVIVMIMYPAIYVVSSSFSSGRAVSGGRVLLWPVEPTLTGYRLVFGNRAVWTGYMNTIIYTVVGTLLNVILTALAAYPLSRRDFMGRQVVMTLFLITMFFSGGLIPRYILMTNLHLTNTRWALILGGAFSTYNMIVMRTFFQNSIPGELLDASKVDGITDFGYFTKIVLPLSKAIFAVITMYYAVGHWNSYFNAMIYFRDRNLYPLQLVLREILVASQIDMTNIQDPELAAQMAGAADVMKYAMIVVATVPILAVYPFVQKYFEKGVMIGSVKG